MLYDPLSYSIVVGFFDPVFVPFNTVVRSSWEVIIGLSLIHHAVSGYQQSDRLQSDLVQARAARGLPFYNDLGHIGSADGTSSPAGDCPDQLHHLP